MVQSARRASTRLAVSGILLSLLTPIGWFYGLQPLMVYLQTHSTHPTGIPWLQSEAECQQSGRVWQDDICWDEEHDANF